MTNPFDASRLGRNLKKKTALGAVINGGSSVLKAVLQFTSVVALSRLLEPESFGLIAMITPIYAVSTIFTSLGLSSATVQKSNLNSDQSSSIFWINVSMGVVFASLLALCSPLVATLYDEPRLTAITAAYALLFFFSGLSAQHNALLSRSMAFSSLALSSIIGMAAGLIAGVVSALNGLEYWSLVIQAITMAAVSCLILWVSCPWRPKWNFQFQPIKGMIQFGANVTGVRIGQVLSRNLDNVLIGKFHGPEALGFYSRGYRLLLFPVQQINSPTEQVMVPVLSRLKDHPERFKKYYYQILGMMVAVSAPLIIFSATFADDLIHTLLGEKWMAVAPIFMVLAPAALLNSFNTSAGWVYRSLGHVDRQLKWAAISIPIRLTFLVAGVPWGVLGVAAGVSCSRVILIFFCLRFCFHNTFLRVSELIGHIWKPMTAAFLSTLVSLGVVSAINPTDPASRLAFGLVIMLLTHIGLLLGPLGWWSQLKDLRTIYQDIWKKA